VTNADPSALSPRHGHRDADWEVRQPPDVDVLIVGSGFSGICLGVRLRQAGIESFLIIEKVEELGGTWRDNRDPGGAYDVPSPLYSLSFAPRSDWRRLYPSPELWEYLRDVADRFGWRPKLRFNVAMSRARWHEAKAHWLVTTNSGATIRASILVSGFPNFFTSLGPDTGIGHHSVVIMIEAQARYLICLLQMRGQRLKVIDCKPEVEDQFFDRIEEQLEPTVWQSGGCRSPYQDRAGHDAAIWPSLTATYPGQTRSATLADFAAVAA